MENVILQASLALLSAALAGWFAIHTYFRQREHELILTRYLEGGIDLLAAELQRVITIFNHNWARCLAILSSFRDLEADFDINELQRGFLDLESSNPHVVAHHRLFTLVGTHEYWLAYQSATAFFAAANTVLVKQIPDVLRMKLTTDRVEADYAEVAEEGFEEARKQQDNSHKYVELLTELQNVAASLESQRLAFKELNQFKNRPEVQQSIQRLNDKLGAEIAMKVAAAQQALRGDSRKAARASS